MEIRHRALHISQRSKKYVNHDYIRKINDYKTSIQSLTSLDSIGKVQLVDLLVKRTSNPRRPVLLKELALLLLRDANDCIIKAGSIFFTLIMYPRERELRASFAGQDIWYMGGDWKKIIREKKTQWHDAL